MTKTMMVEIIVSRREGQVTFAVSERTCCRNVNGLDLDAITAHAITVRKAETISPTHRVSVEP